MVKQKSISKKITNHKTKEDKKNSSDTEEDYWESVTYDDNHIYFYGDVNTKNILNLIRYIRFINNKLSLLENELSKYSTNYDTDCDMNIYLHINSCGGYICDAFAALSHIIDSKHPIISIVEGYAASAATFLSIVCHKRQITSFSSMLIHQLSSGCYGTYEQLEDDHENNRYLENNIKNLYIKYSDGKLNERVLEKVLKRDLMWDPQKCLKYGLVDEII